MEVVLAAFQNNQSIEVVVILETHQARFKVLSPRLLCTEIFIPLDHPADLIHHLLHVSRSLGESLAV